jgi:hypothetical protein
LLKGKLGCREEEEDSRIWKGQVFEDESKNERKEGLR